MRKITLLLLLSLLALQYPLWLGKGGVFRLEEIEHRLYHQQKLNARSQNRNAELAADVWDLKSGTDAVEERARYEFGLIKSEEILFQFVDAS